jgi:hypothetical protein
MYQRSTQQNLVLFPSLYPTLRFCSVFLAICFVLDLLLKDIHSGWIFSEMVFEMAIFIAQCWLSQVTSTWSPWHNSIRFLTKCQACPQGCNRWVVAQRFAKLSGRPTSSTRCRKEVWVLLLLVEFMNWGFFSEKSATSITCTQTSKSTCLDDINLNLGQRSRPQH